MEKRQHLKKLAAQLVTATLLVTTASATFANAATAEEPNNSQASQTANATGSGLVAEDDERLGVVPGTQVNINLLANDSAEAAGGQVSIVGSDDGTSLVVPGEGRWSVSFGSSKFFPEVGFLGNPTPISYTVEDAEGNVSNPATVTITYDATDVPGPPVAVDDESLDNSADFGEILFGNLVGNDSADAYRFSFQIVGANADNELVVPGEGTWVGFDDDLVSFQPEVGFVGNPTPITYTVEDFNGNVSNPATITITYFEVPLVAGDDESLNNTPGATVSLNVLANDTAGARPSRISIVAADADPDPDRTLRFNHELVVPGEGVWTVDPTTGDISFQPEEGFTGNPTPITYTVSSNVVNRGEPGTVTVTYTTVDEVPEPEPVEPVEPEPAEPEPVEPEPVEPVDSETAAGAAEPEATETEPELALTGSNTLWMMLSSAAAIAAGTALTRFSNLVLGSHKRG